MIECIEYFIWQFGALYTWFSTVELIPGITYMDFLLVVMFTLFIASIVMRKFRR